MKKILYFAVAAIALMGCSKTEAVYTPSAEIGFMPVSKYDTKAAISGTTYTNALPFYVYANAKDNGDTKFDSKYFENALFVFEKTDSPATHIYKGNPAQYWPNVNPLIFAGFTKSGNIATLVTDDIAGDDVIAPGDDVIAPGDELTTLTISGYQQPSPTATTGDPAKPMDNDFMYFFADNSGAGYTSQSTYIAPVMKHACSWITIKIKAESDALLAYWDDLEVTNVKFTGLHESGNVVLSKTAAPAWTVTGPQDGNDVAIRTTDLELTTSLQEAANIEANTIVIPQALANTDTDKTAKVQLSVTYSYTTPAGATDFTETKVLDLFYDDDKSAWEPGKHYIYNLTVTATEIKIAPTSEDWVTYLNGNSTADDDVDKDI